MPEINKYISLLKKSKDGRTLVANFGYLSLLQVAGYIFPIITIPYLSRIIGVENFGKIAFASAVVVWFQTVAEWGFNFTATRDVSKYRDDKDKVSEIFSNVLWARIFLMLLSFAFLLIALALIPKFRENSAIIFITFLIVPGNILFPDWFFQAFERMRYTTLLNLLSKLLFTIAIFIFIKEKSDYILQPLITSLGYLVSGLISMYFIIGRWGVKLHKPQLKPIIKTIKESTSMFLNNFVPNLYNSFSIMLLGFYGCSVSNGLLDAGTKFIDTTQQFINVIGRVFFPFLARKLDQHNKYVKINVYLSLIISLLLFLFAPMIIKIFYTSEFYQSINILRFLSITVFFMSIRNAYGTHYMALKGYDKELCFLTFWSSICGFILAFPLVYYFNYWGAAINILLIKGIMAFIVVLKAKKIKNELASQS